MGAVAGDWWTPPETPEGLVDLLQVARDLCSRQSNVGAYLDDAATIMRELNVELPPRGALRELYDDLLTCFRLVERSWLYADDQLLTAAQVVEAECARGRPDVV